MVKQHISNILTVNHAELERIIMKCYQIKRLPLMIWGAPGIGKSWTVKTSGQKLAKMEGLEFIDTKTPNKHPDKFCVTDIRLAQRDPSDVLGLPDVFAIILQDNSRLEIPVKVLQEYLASGEECEIITFTTRWNPPSWLPHEGKGIIFLDEILQAPQLTRSAAAEMIYDGRLGEWTKPEGYMIIGATNRITEAPIFEISPFLANRFAHVELRCPSVEEFVEWGMANGIDSRILAFLMTHQSAIYKFDPKARQHAFPTPRTWHYTSDMIKGIDDLDLIEIYSSICVGPYVAGEFRAFLRLREKLPSIDVYINKPNKVPIPEEHDLLYSLCASLAEYFRTHKDKETLRSIIIISNRLPTEFGVFLMKSCKSIHEGFFKDTVLELKEARPMLKKLGDYLL